MRGAAAVLPMPALDADGDVAMFTPEIVGLLSFREGLHTCVACLGSTVHAFYPAELTGDPRAPEQWADVVGPVGLHPNCVPWLMWQWTVIVWGLDAEDAREPDGVDEFARSAARRAAETDGTAARTGAYGRRRGPG